MARSITSFAKAVAAAGTAEALKATKTLASDAAVKADPANSGTMYIGGSDVDSSNGYPLDPGESVSLSEISTYKNNVDSLIDLNTIYVDAATSGDEVRVLYVPYSD